MKTTELAFKEFTDYLSKQNFDPTNYPISLQYHYTYWNEYVRKRSDSKVVVKV